MCRARAAWPSVPFMAGRQWDQYTTLVHSDAPSDLFHLNHTRMQTCAPNTRTRQSAHTQARGHAHFSPSLFFFSLSLTTPRGLLGTCPRSTCRPRSTGWARLVYSVGIMSTTASTATLPRGHRGYCFLSTPSRLLSPAHSLHHLLGYIFTQDCNRHGGIFFLLRDIVLHPRDSGTKGPISGLSREMRDGWSPGIWSP